MYYLFYLMHFLVYLLVHLQVQSVEILLSPRDHELSSLYLGT